MSMTDPIADMLTRIRNGIMAKKSAVSVPLSNQKLSIAKILHEEGYVRNVEVIEDFPKGSFMVHLKYTPHGESVVRNLHRISKPGRRQYAGADGIPRVRNGVGMAIVSTSKGMMTDRRARSERLGGEIICEVY